MSMLTPPGLKGKQYRITGTAYPRLARPSRRRRYTVFAVVGVTVLAVLGWGSVQLFGVFGGGKADAAALACGARASAAPSGSAAAATGGDAASAGPSGRASGGPSAGPSAGHSGTAPTAAPTAVAAFASLAGVVAPKPATIKVNVYNATDRAGLAGQTAALLKKRGFTIGTIGNAPAALQNKVPGTAEVTGNKAAAARMTVLGSEVPGSSPVTDLRKDASVDLVLGNGFTALSTPAQQAQTLALAAKPVPARLPGHC